MITPPRRLSPRAEKGVYVAYALLAAEATPGERAAVEGADLADHRDFYGLHDPDEHVMPKVWAEEYNREYGGHEQDFLLSARRHGLDSKLVGELRDAGIRLAIESEGRPATDEAWARLEKKFTGQLTPKQFSSLRA